jgi:hypothetical protein
MLEVSILPVFTIFLFRQCGIFFIFFPVIFHIPSNSPHIVVTSVSTICDWILELIQQCCIFKNIFIASYMIFFLQCK